MDGHKKITYTNFQIFLNIFLAEMVEIVVVLKLVIDFLKISTINYFDKKNWY